MSDTPTADKTMQVLVRIPNLAHDKGAPVYLVKDPDGRHALAREIGQNWQLETGWVDWDAAADIALRVAGGDPSTLTNTRVLRGLAVAVLAIAAEAQEAAAAAGKPGPLAGAQQGSCPL